MKRDINYVGSTAVGVILFAVFAFSICAPRAALAAEPARKPDLLVAPFDKDTALKAREAWAKHLKTDELVKNSVGIKLMLIPPGDFQMGSTRKEAPTAADETLHAVRISRPFYLGMYEVTQEEFELVMKRNPSMFSAGGEHKDRVSGFHTARYPVEGVSWFDVIEFCNKLSEKEKLKPYYGLKILLRRTKGSIENADVKIIGGNGYRLPTEADWEYACRAGTTTPYYFGNELSTKNANIAGTGREAQEFTEKFGKPREVGNYPPNGFGLFDMHGNVLEWCWDWRADYQPSRETDPTGPSSGSARVLRGGYWQFPPTMCRSARRIYSGPGWPADGGIRLARNP